MFRQSTGVNNFPDNNYGEHGYDDDDDDDNGDDDDDDFDDGQSELQAMTLETDQELEPHTENWYPAVYPSFEYKKNAKGIPETCSVCRADFADSDDCRRLPCLHYFHNECIDRWVLVHRNCPLCRTKC